MYQLTDECGQWGAKRWLMAGPQDGTRAPWPGEVTRGLGSVCLLWLDTKEPLS